MEITKDENQKHSAKKQDLTYLFQNIFFHHSVYYKSTYSERMTTRFKRSPLDALGHFPP